MFGAIIGDITANRYASDSKHVHQNKYTSYSLYTVAIADALSHLEIDASKNEIEESVKSCIEKWLKFCPDLSELQVIYPTVSAVGWLYDSLERTIQVTGWIIDLFDHEQIKDAITVSSVIFLARKKYNKEQIFQYVDLLGLPEYSLSLIAFKVFMDNHDFPASIYNAFQVGHDKGTIGTITGAMMEAYYGAPAILIAKAIGEMEKEMGDTLVKISIKLRNQNPFLVINEGIEKSIIQYYREYNIENENQVYYSIINAIDLSNYVVIPVITETLFSDHGKNRTRYYLKKEVDQNGTWYLCYLSHQKAEINYKSLVMLKPMLEFLEYVSTKKVDGILIDPGSYPFYLTQKMIKQIIIAVKRGI